MSHATASSRALDIAIRLGGPEADALKSSFSRATLWRWRKGKTTPNASDAGTIERLTKGAAPANGWTVPAPTPFEEEETQS